MTLLLRSFLMKIRYGAGILERFLIRLESVCLIGILLMMLGLSLLQIILRTGWHTGFMWIDPLCRGAVLWTALLGGALAVAQKKTIQIDVADRFLPAHINHKVQMVLSTLGCVLCLYLAWIGGHFLVQEKEFADIFFLKVPLWWIETIMPIGFGLMAWHFLARLLHATPEAEHS